MEISKQKIGEILMQSGTINLIHLSMALDVQRFNDMPLGEILIKLQIINSKQLKEALCVQEVSS